MTYDLNVDKRYSKKPGEKGMDWDVRISSHYREDFGNSKEINIKQIRANEYCKDSKKEMYKDWMSFTIKGAIIVTGLILTLQTCTKAFSNENYQNNSIDKIISESIKKK